MSHLDLPDFKPPSDLVVVASITGSYGIKGWIKLNPDSAPSNSVLLHTKSWWLQAGSSSAQAVTVNQVRPQGRDIVAQIARIDVREQAQALRGQRVLVRRSDFPVAHDGEYYWIDLIGCTVENAVGQVLGQVEEVVDHGAHSILVVKPAVALISPDVRELLIPFVAHYLLTVDLPGKRIRVDWEPAW
jgi:16S rRNA processing protein RimM